jgi:hypothetical protein
MAKLSDKNQVSNKMMLLFINLVIIYSILTVCVTETKSDKWDENVRPKLFFDFLKESSDEVKETDPNQGKAGKHLSKIWTKKKITVISKRLPLFYKINHIGFFLVFCCLRSLV